MLNFEYLTNPETFLGRHPHLPKYQLIKDLVDDIGHMVHVLSTTYDSCVVIAPNAMLASVTSDILLGYGIYSRIIRGHFIDAYYLTIRYENS